MCGRYVLNPTPEVVKIFKLENKLFNFESLKPAYNIAPGFTEPVVVKNSPNHLELMRWGLIPPWAKDIRIGYKMINARCEGINTKPSFRKPLRSQRCLIPANGFYEWKRNENSKQPYFISVTNQPVFGMAGLFEIAHDGEGREIKSFTIITCAPNSLMAEIHNRMPVILSPQDYDFWLDNSGYHEDILLKLLTPYAGQMTKIPVSPKVNKTDNQGEDLIYPLKI